MPKKLKKVRVLWADHEHYPESDGWCEIKEVEQFAQEPAMMCNTVGHLFADHPHFIVVVGTVNGEQCSAVTKIIKSAIEKVYLQEDADEWGDIMGEGDGFPEAEEEEIS